METETERGRSITYMPPVGKEGKAMKHRGIRAACLITALALLCGNACFLPASAEPAGQTTRAAGPLSAAGADALPDYEWQKTASFPDWKGYTDDTLAMNSMLSFYFWHGQGSLWLEVSETVESFAMYVNGIRCDTSAVGAGVWQVDISGVSADGVNTLQVSNILPLGQQEAVTVYVPYPEVLEGDGGTEGIRPETLQLISDTIESDVEYGFTSAQLAVVRNGRLVYSNAWGSISSYEPDGRPKAGGIPATTDTLYDLASVTKMFSVNYAVQQLVTDRELDIDAPVTLLLGDGFAEETLAFAYGGTEDGPGIETQKEWKRRLTVKDLLRHQAGFPAGPHYFDPDYDMALLAKGENGSSFPTD